MSAPEVPRPGPVLPATIPAEGLEIRAWRVEDVPALAEAITSSIEHLRPFMPWVAVEPVPDEERAAMVRRWEQQRVTAGDAVYGIFREGRAVGGIGAHRGDGKLRHITDDAREIGYWLRASEEGHGTMTRAVEVLTAALLATPEITHVEIQHDQANTRSGAVAERAGYRIVRHTTRAVEAPAETGSGLVWRIGTDPVPEVP